MTDYTKLIDALRRCASVERCEGRCEMNYGITDCESRLEMDAADAIEDLQAEVPKRGEWIMDGKYSRHCSICNESVAWPEKYCPNCGAKMEVQE